MRSQYNIYMSFLDFKAFGPFTIKSAISLEMFTFQVARHNTISKHVRLVDLIEMKQAT